LEAESKFSKKMIKCALIEKNVAKPFKADAIRKVVPEWDRDRCIQCGICYIYCPDGAIFRMEDGYFDIDEKRCKGCGICHRECWFGVINMVGEE
jgi:pyruvate ferredoxin oxidoreductase delta subunit